MSEIQISKTLLILKSTQNSTLSAENFLRNREWVVYSTANLKEFLTHIIQKKPSFVMISVDHPNKKVLMMPKVLTQSFPVCVFAFAEQSSAISFRKLQEVHCAYRINPPATGPAIERTVNKYLKDQEKKLRDQEDGKNSPTGETKSVEGAENIRMSFSQNISSDNSTTAIEGAGWGQAASIFAQLLDDDASKSNASSGESGSLQTSGAGVIVAKGDKAAAGNSWLPSDELSDPGSSANGNEKGVEGSETSDGNAGKILTTSIGRQTGAILGSEGKIGSDQAGEFESSKPANQIADLDIKSKKGHDSVAGSFNEKEIEQGEQARRQGEQRGSANSHTKRYQKDGKIITIMGKNSGPQESIILKGTKQSLDETVDIKDGNVKQEIKDASQVACIVVESDKFNGYLIAAMGKDRKMDGHFIKAIQSRLFKFLKDNGETVSNKENLNLKIKKVEFEDWAVEYAEFLKKSVHNGEEIAMAFFPVSNVRVEVSESAASTMASVKMSEIDGDKIVEFNLYIYLPNNKKYILYTPKGGTFFSNQKGRLEEKGVKEMHMLKSEIQDLSKYKAQNYLNNLIDAYKKKKTGSTSVA